MERRAFLQGLAAVGGALTLGAWAPQAAADTMAANPYQLIRAVTYTVRRGDTLSGIATAHGLEHWEPIWQANRGWLSDPNLIRPGMELVIPVEGAPLGPPAPPEDEPQAAPQGTTAALCGFEDSWVTSIIINAAGRYGQSPCQMMSVAWCESRHDPSAYNRSSGASGLFQFLPSTWRSTPYAGSSIFDAYASANAAGWMWSVGRRSEWVC